MPVPNSTEYSVAPAAAAALRRRARECIRSASFVSLNNPQKLSPKTMKLSGAWKERQESGFLRGVLTRGQLKGRFRSAQSFHVVSLL